MHFVVRLLLKVVVEWIKAHPDEAFSRFMLKQRGPASTVLRQPGGRAYRRPTSFRQL
jgi:hypothetical protein